MIKSGPPSRRRHHGARGAEALRPTGDGERCALLDCPIHFFGRDQRRHREIDRTGAVGRDGHRCRGYIVGKIYDGDDIVLTEGAK